MDVDKTLDDSLAGQVLDGRYRVESMIARGGMATVYLATDARLDRTVALKVMHPELARHDEFVSRFIREAKTAARLTHPNIVGVFDQSADGGRVYLAMEYVPGCTLRELLADRGRLTPREALDILAPMLSALGAAHRAGMVHRDVKPENVLIAEEGSYAHAVKVADFGLARSAAAGATISMAGMIVGTASYLAPEQVKHGVCDARSDVYSAGIVLFELLTGQKPFTGDTPIQVAYRHVHDHVPAPSTLVPGLDPAIDALVVRATSQDPTGRPGDANVFHTDLLRTYSSLPDAALDYGAVRNPDNPDQAATQQLTAVQELGKLSQTKVMPTPAVEQTARHVSNTEPTPPHGQSRQSGQSGKASGNPGAGQGKPEPKKVLAPRKSANDPYRYVSADKKFHLSRGHVALIMVLIVALIVAVASWWFAVGQFRAVPGIVHQTQVAAVAELTRDGLHSKVTEAYDEIVPAGQVIDSTPAPKQHVVRGGTVELKVSKGPSPVPVPDESGKTQADATADLEKAGFHATVSPQSQYSETVAAGSVISQTPSSRAQRGSTVTLVISQGEQQYKVPDVTGISADDAKAKLLAQGFDNVTVTGLSLGTTVGSQDPPGGSSAKHHDPITLHLRFLP